MKIVGRGISWLKDLLFPIYCVTCGKEGEWWCARCRPDNVSLINEQFPNMPMKHLTALYAYEERGVIGRLIKDFKYHGAYDMRSLWQVVLSSHLPVAGMEVIPVPLFNKRARDRGYNQAEILARIIADTYGVKLCVGGLVRHRSTEQQAKKTKHERLANIAGAFLWKESVAPSKHVLLVDDVYTTGATMQECAKILLRHGTETVRGFTLARG